MIEWIAENSAFVQSITTIVLAVIAVFTFVLMLRQQRKENLVKLRPYIFINRASDKVTGDGFNVFILNTGQTPGELHRIQWHMGDNAGEAIDIERVCGVKIGSNQEKGFYLRLGNTITDFREARVRITVYYKDWTKKMHKECSAFGFDIQNANIIPVLQGIPSTARPGRFSRWPRRPAATARS